MKILANICEIPMAAHGAIESSISVIKIQNVTIYANESNCNKHILNIVNMISLVLAALCFIDGRDMEAIHEFCFPAPTVDATFSGQYKEYKELHMTRLLDSRFTLLQYLLKLFIIRLKAYCMYV